MYDEDYSPETLAGVTAPTILNIIDQPSLELKQKIGNKTNRGLDYIKDDLNYKEHVQIDYSIWQNIAIFDGINSNFYRVSAL